MMKRMFCILLVIVMLSGILLVSSTEAKAHQVVMTAEEFIECLKIANSRPNYYYNSFPYNLGYYDGSRISFDC